MADPEPEQLAGSSEQETQKVAGLAHDPERLYPSGFVDASESIESILKPAGSTCVSVW